MAKGKKTGGRRRGSKNKVNRQRELQKAAAEGGLTPHHCGWAGSLNEDAQYSQVERRPQYRKPSKLLETSLPKSMADWSTRAITGDVLKRNRIESRRAYFPQLKNWV